MWRLPPYPGTFVEELSARIRRVRGDLAVIEAQLSQPLSQLHEHAPEDDSAGSPLVLEEVKVLKTAIDQMRACLWSYLAAVPRPERTPSSPAPDPQCAATMLDSQDDPGSQTTSALTCEARTFFEKVESLATELVDKHMKGTF